MRFLNTSPLFLHTFTPRGSWYSSRRRGTCDGKSTVYPHNL